MSTPTNPSPARVGPPLRSYLGIDGSRPHLFWLGLLLIILLGGLLLAVAHNG